MMDYDNPVFYAPIEIYVYQNSGSYPDKFRWTATALAWDHKIMKANSLAASSGLLRALKKTGSIPRKQRAVVVQLKNIREFERLWKKGQP